MGQRRTIVLAVGVFVLVLFSLQLFLLMVGLEALLTFDRPLAWAAAITSAVLALVSGLLYRYLRPLTPGARPGMRDRRSSRRPSRVGGSR
jgi:membrane protein implicated in regulation of membrane protease activity